MNDTSHNRIRDLVLEKIKTGKAHMRPRWHFVLKTVLAVTGLVIIAVVAVYVASFVVFVFHHTGMEFLSGFGLRGLGRLLISLPWIVIGLGLVFVGILELLVRHYPFAYRKPLLYSLVGVVGVVVAGSFVVAKTSFHEGLLMRVRQGRLPIVAPLYRGFELERGRHTHIGSITTFVDEGLRMKDRAGDDLFVIVNSDTSFPRGVDFQEGDFIFVLGDRDRDTIKALGIRRINDRPERPFMQRGWYRPSISPMMR